MDHFKFTDLHSSCKKKWKGLNHRTTKKFPKVMINTHLLLILLKTASLWNFKIEWFWWTFLYHELSVTLAPISKFKFVMTSISKKFCEHSKLIMRAKSTEFMKKMASRKKSRPRTSIIPSEIMLRNHWYSTLMLGWNTFLKTKLLLFKLWVCSQLLFPTIWPPFFQVRLRVMRLIFWSETYLISDKTPISWIPISTIICFIGWTLCRKKRISLENYFTHITYGSLPYFRATSTTLSYSRTISDCFMTQSLESTASPILNSCWLTSMNGSTLSPLQTMRKTIWTMSLKNFSQRQKNKNISWPKASYFTKTSSEICTTQLLTYWRKNLWKIDHNIKLTF